jgi:hypothetical protein
MTRAETVREIVATLESDNPRQVSQYLEDDFVFVGPFPGPLDKEQFLEYMAATKRAFPDWLLHYNFIREEDKDTLRGIIQRQGTHLGDFSLPGLAAIPPTEMTVILPIEPIRFIFKDEELARIEIEDASGGGLEGILEQLGAELPRCLHGIFDKYPETV